jgi:hypothetical protein
MLPIHHTAGESLVIGNEIQVVVVVVKEAQVRLTLTGVSGCAPDFVLDNSSAGPDVSDAIVRHVRVRRIERFAPARPLRWV